jgi:hypothetical protein
MNNFNKMLHLISESEITEDSLNKLLSKHGKVTSKATANNKDIRFLVNLGDDKEKAIESLDAIQKVTGRNRTHLVTDGKTFSAEVIITNAKYVAQKEQPLDQTDRMYGRTKHGVGGSLGS